MSPGLQPRPSLSGPRCRSWARCCWLVSPGLQPRPSLSVANAVVSRQAAGVSPGLQPRPSLSDPAHLMGGDVGEACRRGYSPGPH